MYSHRQEENYFRVRIDRKWLYRWRYRRLVLSPVACRLVLSSGAGAGAGVPSGRRLPLLALPAWHTATPANRASFVAGALQRVPGVIGRCSAAELCNGHPAGMAGSVT